MAAESRLAARFLRSAIAALLLPAAALAQQPQPQQGALEEITVTGTRIIRSGMVTPVPTTAVQAAELQNMSAGPLFDSLVQLPPFFANQAPEQVNGGQNSGGSNLNLRGAGLNRTLVLLDGRRVVPTNRFGAVDVAMFPEELVQQRRGRHGRRLGELRHRRRRGRRELHARHGLRGLQRPRSDGRDDATATATRTKPASRSASASASAGI